MFSKEYIEYIGTSFLSVDIKYWDYKLREHPMSVNFIRSRTFKARGVAYIPCVYKNKIVELDRNIWNQ